LIDVPAILRLTSTSLIFLRHRKPRIRRRREKMTGKEITQESLDKALKYHNLLKEEMAKNGGDFHKAIATLHGIHTKQKLVFDDEEKIERAKYYHALITDEMAKNGGDFSKALADIHGAHAGKRKD